MAPRSPATIDGEARRELRFQEREQRILEAARRLLLAEGFHAITMDALAESIHYSKATVYKHFQSSEDGGPQSQFILEFEVSVGEHPAHTF